MGKSISDISILGKSTSGEFYFGPIRPNSSIKARTRNIFGIHSCHASSATPSMSKRPAEVMAPSHQHKDVYSDHDSDASDSGLPVNWRTMINGNFQRFSLFESDKTLDSWSLSEDWYIYKAFAILHVAFKPLFVRYMQVSQEPKCLMWNDCPCVPLMDGMVKAINVPLLLEPIIEAPVAAAAKKPRLDICKSFDQREKDRVSQAVDYYDISDDEEEEVIAKKIIVPLTENQKAIIHVEQIVEELEKVRIKVIGVDMLQNRKSFAYHANFCKVEGLDPKDAITVYHGTSEFALNGGLNPRQVGLNAPQGGIISGGLLQKKVKRTVFGEGIYTSTDFQVAKNFAMEYHNMDNSTAIVLVLSCHVGKIRYINKYSQNLDSFVDENGDMCSTKFVGSMNYHIVSDDHQLFVRYAVRFQQIDNINIFPAKVQAQKDEQAKKAASEKKRLADLAALKLIFDAKEAHLAKVAKDVKDAKDAKEAKEAKDAKDAKEAKEAKEAKDAKDAKEAKEAKDADDAHKARVAKMMANSLQKREVYRKQRLDKLAEATGASSSNGSSAKKPASSKAQDSDAHDPDSDDQDWEECLSKARARGDKKRLLQSKRTSVISPVNLDLSKCNNIHKGDSIRLTKMTKVNSYLEGQMGTVRQIVMDTAENGHKVYYMVAMDDKNLQSTIRYNNIHKEKGNHGPGYARFGPLFSTNYFICRRDKIF